LAHCAPRCLETHLVLGVLYSILSEELQLRQLEELVGIGDRIKRGAEVFERLLVADGHERGEGIALACAVGLRFKEGLKKLGGIGDERLGVLEDRSDSPHGVLADVGVTVFQTRTGRGKEGLDEFGLAQLGQEPEGITADIFVRVLKIVTNTVAVG